MSEHAMPTRACFGIVRLAICATALDESEFAIGNEHAARRALRQETAGWTGLAAESQRAALAAFEQHGRTTLEPRLMRWGLSTPIGIQRPFDMVFRRTMAEDGAAVIEDDAIGLAVGRTQTASDHLAIQPHLLGRPSQDDAANIGAIETFGKYHAVGDDLDLAALDPSQYRVALLARRRAVEMLGAHASLNELVADMEGMTNAAGKSHGAPALAIFVPMSDDVADQLGAIHALGKLSLNVITGLRLDAAQIGINRGVNPRLDQIALLDQRCDLRALDHGGEDPAKAAAIAATGRGR